jgi:hypothetical protein
MLWKTHIRIANEILTRLRLSKSSIEADRLREGCIVPDKWKDYPHHEGKSEDIQYRILDARKYFLRNDLPEAYFNLGVALHYIQDGYTTLSSHSRHHTRWENQIDQSYFTDDLENLVGRTFRNSPDRREEYTRYSRVLTEKVEGKKATLRIATMNGPGLSYWGNRQWGKPYIDLNFALRASLVVARAVLSPRTKPNLQKRLFDFHTMYQLKMEETERQTAQELVELIKKCIELKNCKKKGAFETLRKKFQSMTYNFRAKRSLNNYEQQEHLDKVVYEYQNMVNGITYSHFGWYNFDVPKLDVNSIEKDLLSKQEIKCSI